MLSNRFKINEYDKYIFIKRTPNSSIIVCLYVDDMLIMENNYAVIINIKRMLSKHFEVKDMGKAYVILGIKIIRTVDDLIFIIVALY